MPRETNPAYVRTTMSFPVILTGVLNQSGAVTYLASYAMPFKASLEKITYIPEVAGAGSGATQVFSVRKGGATGTVLASVDVTLALHVLAGPGIVGSVAAADEAAAKFNDGDTLSITKAAGTVFTTAGGHLILTFRQRPQAKV